MAYCTQSDLTNVCTADELEQLTSQTGTLDTTTVDLAIESAAGKIDGYLRTRYTLPIVGTPPELVQINCDIARFYLFADILPDAVKYRYEEAMKQLSDIAKGIASIGIDFLAENTGTATLPSIKTSDKVMTDDLLAKMT